MTVHWLGFPVTIHNGPMIKIRGEDVLDISPADLARQVYQELSDSYQNLTVEQKRFIDRYQSSDLGGCQSEISDPDKDQVFSFSIEI